MMIDIEDRDLFSVQEARNLVKKSKEAQQIFSSYSPEKIDKIVEAVAKEASKESEYLAKLAHSETKYGNWQDKLKKNKLASDKVYEHIKDMKVLGILKEDKEKGVVEIGIPVGVITALIPVTNPTSTSIYKALIALKSGNSIIFSPHPHALNSIKRSAQILNSVAVQNGAPDGIITCLGMPTLDGTNELMKHKDVAMILATGGGGMVRAAYSSGTPALGVGPGNVPVFIERSADIPLAVQRIFEGKTFDNGTVCSSEQSIITEKVVEDEVKNEIVRQGGYFLQGEKLDKVIQIMDKPDGSLNPKIVGKSAMDLSKMADIEVPENTRVLLCEEKGIGKEFPFSKEKLSCLLGFYTVKDSGEAIDLSKQLLEYGGLGHTSSIHSNDEEIIKQYALNQPVSRVVVNTPSSLGAVGMTTNLAPALTLGSGAIGGSATSDNISPLNLINIKSMAYGIEKEDVKEENVHELLEDVVDTNSVNIDMDVVTELVMERIKKIINN